ncbi:MAG: type 2 lanthipeptide synthetase LanM family protein, partial [Cyanobacteria bacterium J06659_2]
MSTTLIATSPQLTDGDLATIVAEASFLWERLDADRFTVAPHQSNPSAMDRRCERWCQTVAHENRLEILQKRLEWDGLSLDEVRPYLGTVKFAAGQPLPAWAETLRQMIQTGAGFTPNPDLVWLSDPDHPTPFEDIWLPTLQVARQNLLTRLGVTQLTGKILSLSLLSEKAYTTLERSLLQRLTQISNKTLDFEFSKGRSLGQNLLNLLGIEEAETGHSQTQYHQFVTDLLADGLLSFLQTYPVLGRLIAVAVDLWVDATAEFIQRLAQDQTDIQQRFSPSSGDFSLNNTPYWGVGGAQASNSECQNAPLGKVTDLQASLSDPHNQGRTVLLLTFESGLTLVYKPKDSGLEVAWNHLLTWCNQHNQLLDFKVIQVLNRDGYGWVEYVEQLPCHDEAAVERFYQRAGMLSCLIYVLRGTDCHHENLIASGEHLVLIDIESLLQHDVHLIENSPDALALETESTQLFGDSVLRTGLLPQWDFSPDQRLAFDISGLGSTDPQPAPCKVLRWQAVNTDDMHLRAETVTAPIAKNVPHLGDTPLSPNDYQVHIVTGFECMYRFLMQQQNQLLAAGGPLAGLQNQQVRFIMRATRIYYILLHKAWTPDHLKHGVDYSIELDYLSRAFVLAQQQPNAWPIVQAELRAMEQLDIPFFTANTSNDALILRNIQTISQYFKRPSYDYVISQIQALNETNLAQQVAIIQGAFYARVAQPSVDEARPWQANELPLLSREQLIQAAVGILQGSDLEVRALQDTDCSLNWISLGFVPQANRYQLQLLTDSLYDGRCGVALFLAGLYHVTQEPHYRDLTLRVLHPLRRQLNSMTSDARQRFARRMGIGIATGITAMIYTFVKVGQFLEDETFLTEAQTLATMITPEMIAADQALDIISGAAGSILGSLSLYQVTGEITVLEKAIACGQHLLSQQTHPASGPKAWKNLAEKPLTGFSHGATGIAYALLRLYAITDDPDYREAALEGMAYERSVFSPTQANWP